MFADFRQNESFVSFAESQWNKWLEQAEELFGKTLDGDIEFDGYDLESAEDAWDDGMGLTPQEFIDSLDVNQE